MSSPLQKKETMKVPEPTLRRLPWYLSNVKLLKQKGERFVSSTQISKEINIDASQIAKDLSYVNISGRTRVGSFLKKSMKKNDWKERLNIVYSTNQDYKYEMNDDEEQATLPPAQQRLRVQLDRKNRGGKVVTLVTFFMPLQLQ